MEESQNGNAPNSSTKATSASFDEDFGKDFLTSWKSTKFGNDAMDFDVETSKEKGQGKKFNFGKLDDFDLDADFDKLPSFKMDMSDLDFSSPFKKNTTKPSTEKSLKDSLPGKDKGKEPFSFSFNFDDLGKFDLDSHLSIKEKEASKIKSSTSIELGFNKAAKENSSTEIVDIPKIDSIKAPSKPETCSSTSRPPSTEQHNSEHPSCDLSNGSGRSIKRQFNIASISGNSNHKEAQAAQSHSMKGNPENKRESSAQSLESYSQLKRSASPVISSNNQDNVSGARSSDSGVSTKRNLATISIQNDSERNSVGVKEAGIEKGLSSTATTSAVQRDFRHLKLIPIQEKVTPPHLYKPEPNSVLTSKQPGDSKARIEVLNSDSQDMERQSNKDDAHAKSNLLTAPEKAPKIVTSVCIGNGNPETENRTFSTLKNTEHSLPTNDALLTNQKQTLVSNPITSKHTKMNHRRSPNATPERDLTLTKLREIKKTLSQHTPCALPNSASKEKPALLSPPLKRKLVEESVPDPFTPLKRTLISLAEKRTSPMVALKSIHSSLESRKSPETAVQSAAELVTGNESADAFRDDKRSPICATQTLLRTADFEIPVPVLESNGNVEKAEAISKELGDISSMLKKQQEEAKELLVRAIVSNNKLLMLNHPMYAEKLSGLERFASALRSRRF